MKEDELRNPTTFDTDGEECLVVLKNSNATGVTYGRSTGIESLVWEYDKHGIRSTSMEVPVYPYSQKDGAFAAPGIPGPSSLMVGTHCRPAHCRYRRECIY